MKENKSQVIHIVFTSLLILLTVILIALVRFSINPLLPNGLSISGWKVQGLTEQQFTHQFQKKIHLLHHQRVTLHVVNNSQPFASFFLEQLGLQTNEQQIQHKIHALFTSSWWQRIQQRWALKNKNLSFHISFSQPILQKALQLQWPQVERSQPINAQRIITINDQIHYKKSEPAYRFNTNSLIKKLDSLFPAIFHSEQTNITPIVMIVPIHLIQPKVTIDDLQSQGIRRRISAFSTAYPASSAGRIYNIHATATVLNNFLLAPGKVFDYAKIIQKTEQKFGWREAPIILNGEVIPGEGGGICQVSTTLYNAALRAGLQIVERRNHSLPVSYAALGQDATFASGFINFKFRNTTSSYLLIRTEMTNQNITVKIFGGTSAEVTYEIQSKVIQTIPPGIKYVSNAQLPLGEELLLREGKPGYIVETYRIKKEHQTVLKKERISKDLYKPQPTLIAVHQADSGQDEKDSKAKNHP